VFQVLVDTSVWLDLAQDQKQGRLIDSLEAMIKKKLLVLVVPRIILSEFQQNRGRLAERAQKSLSSQFNQVKEAIRKSELAGTKKDQMLEYLSDVSHKIPLVGGMAISTLTRIETLLNAAPPIEATDGIKIRASDRALSGKAPCHHENKNSMADAVLIETYLEVLKGGKPGDRFAFVTHNKHDFSDMRTNQKNPHPDIASGFSKIKSLYCVTLADCLRRIDPAMVEEAIWENNYEPPIRSLTEILAATDFLTDQVWYNRHKNHAWEIAHGKAKVVTQDEWDKGYRAKGWRYNQTHTVDSVWEGAVNAAKAKERQYGKKNLGPWSDFEWGMINGKLSALRWALGDEWDMLDT
jgi:hypothetical protein